MVKLTSLSTGASGDVAEGDVLEDDLALDGRGFDRVGLLGNDVVGIEDGANAVDADRSLRNGVGGGGQVFHRLEELAEVRQVHGQRADRHRSGQDQGRAAPQHDGRAQRDRNGHHRREHRLDSPRGQSGVHRGMADVGQIRLLHVLAAEGLHHLHGFQTLLHHGDDLALLLADLVGGLLHRLLEARYKEQQKRA